ncbi:MAG TPA: hypothetical protein VFU98_08695, partial [Microlunatus sp.]|nr:hypothetical protein [Microlunatus sp.]
RAGLPGLRTVTGLLTHDVDAGTVGIPLTQLQLGAEVNGLIDELAHRPARPRDSGGRARMVTGRTTATPEGRQDPSAEKCW